MRPVIAQALPLSWAVAVSVPVVAGSTAGAGKIDDP
jgi:hypothetical protein